MCVAVASFACASVAGAVDATTGSTAGSDAAPLDSAAAPAAPAVPGSRPNNFFNYGVDVGVGYSDNITETQTDKRSDEMFGVGVQLAGLDQGARFQGAMLGDLEHVNYLQGTYSPEVIGNFAGYATYALVPDFLRWLAEDNFGQGVIDPFATQTPGNLENINTFTTGPTLTMPLGALTQMNVSARYTRVSYQTSPLDSNDYGAALSLTHLLSARSRFSLNVQDERYEYTDPINPSYDDREAFARYDIQGARTRITVDGGYDQIHGEQLDSNGGLARLTVSRNVALDSVVSLSAGRDTSNSSTFLAQNQSVSGLGLGATSGRQTATPFVNEYESLGWNFIRHRTTVTLSLSHYLQLYDGQTNLDQSMSSAQVRLTRVVYPGWTLGVFGDYTKVSFAQPLLIGNGNYNEEHGGMTVKWQMARKLALTFEYDHFNRDSDQAAFTYSENRVWVRLTYGTASPNGLAGGGSSDAANLNVVNSDPFSIPTPSR